MATKIEKAGIEAIRAAIITDRNFAIQALLTVYAAQTSTERSIAATIEDNGVGFSGADAEFATSLCEQYNRRGNLSEKQWPYVCKIAKKYAVQVYNAGMRAPEVKEVVA